MPTVVLFGTLDTKHAEYAYVRDRIRAFGVDTLTVDVGIFGDDDLADITNKEVAAGSDVDLDAIVESRDRGLAVEAMARAGADTVERLYETGRLDGIIALGGTGGTALGSQAMQRLPVGVPKLMVSTVASGDTRPYVGALDITMMYSVVDIAGINRISRRILGNAAGAIAGMVTATLPEEVDDRRLVGATMFGVTTPGVEAARRHLEDAEYDVLVFHATGTGGRSMEELVKAGMLDGVLDLTTTELADELVGGVFSAGEERLTVAGKAGLPQVVSLGALDMVNFGAMDTVPAQFRNRNLYKHNPTTTLMRTTPEECRELGRRVATRLNEANGPLTVFVPLKGISMIATEGGPFYDPEADEVLIASLQEHLKEGIDLRLIEKDINDECFAQTMAEALIGYMEA